MQTFFNPTDRQEILRRLADLTPEASARWGRMSAPQMVVHLTDQMRHALGDVPSRPVPGLLRWAPVRYASIYLVPWPRGLIQGPPDAFLTLPASWDSDLSLLRSLVVRFADTDPLDPWPPHALFGPMRGRDWGVFCYKHFHHHLTQFGA